MKACVCMADQFWQEKKMLFVQQLSILFLHLHYTYDPSFVYSCSVTSDFCSQMCALAIVTAELVHNLFLRWQLLSSNLDKMGSV